MRFSRKFLQRLQITKDAKKVMSFSIVKKHKAQKKGDSIMSYQQFNNSNSLNIDGFQVAIEVDRTRQLAKRVSSRQFAIPVDADEVYFWLLIKPLFQDASVYVGINGIMSKSSWVADQGSICRFDHQADGDRGRFCVMRRRGNEAVATAYADAGVTGALAMIDLEFHMLLPEYRSQIGYAKGIGDDVRGSRSSYDVGGTLGDATRGEIFENTRGGDKGFNYEEAIIATGGQTSMSTRKVQREEDDSSPIIRFSLEIVAATSNIRIPNPTKAPRKTFSW